MRSLVVRTAWVAVAVPALVVAVASFVALLGQDSLDVLFQGGILALNPEMRSGLNEIGLSSELILDGVFAFRLVGMIVFTLTAFVIFLRRSEEWLTGVASAMLLLLGAAWFAPVSVLSGGSWDSVVAIVGPSPPWSPLFVGSLTGVVVFAFLCGFPDGRLVPRWTRVLIGAAVLQLALTLLPGWRWGIEQWPAPLRFSWVLLFAACGLGAQIYRFTTTSTHAQKRQTRLVLAGIASVAALPPLIMLAPRLGDGFSGLSLVTPRIEAIYELILLVLLALALLMLPVSIAVSVLRYGLWDMRLFVNRALVYGTLTALVAFVYLAGVLLLGGLLGTVVGRLPASNLAVLASTVAVTLLFQPARRRLQNEVDRRFFRQKYDAVRTLEDFSSRLRHEVDLDSLVSDLVSVVEDTMQPAHVSLWLRTESGGSLPVPAERVSAYALS